MARGLAPVRLRSSRKIIQCSLSGKSHRLILGGAAQPNGGKPPRHRSCVESVNLRHDDFLRHRSPRIVFLALTLRQFDHRQLDFLIRHLAQQVMDAGAGKHALEFRYGAQELAAVIRVSSKPWQDPRNPS
ncbi:hypothetical protein PputUW4_01874 [Pseudomonas sp. UW4]|nr:hypothetical protein PputUW4_01874 [Pseudomonas sp. UW4]